ncbi:Translationally controlled tumor protein [Carpediemonas membranifera]|uniref:Translationally controlled tumor protein n=1 Tax=Carpediemonas membranifera TaxID=201153 RepID=A0A8J6DYU5_9EUKA|nr:Translationally controlled tumor protein [Carpediemonas membranifera]|eukprot:KAG9392754.1 Translationally controlled tumor protein [Carpediemonas membranifera]
MVLLYKDAFTGDELCTDVYPCKEIENGMGLVFTGAMVQVKDGVEGFENNDEEGGALEDGVRTVVNIVEYNSLEQTAFDKKSFQVFLKSYVKKILKHLEEKHPDQVADFKANATGFVKYLISNFKEFDFYQGASMDPEGGVVMNMWEGETPLFIFFKHGLEEEKL